MEMVIRVNTTNIIIRKINLNRLRNLAAPIGAGKLSPEAEKEIKDFHKFLKSLAENLSPEDLMEIQILEKYGARYGIGVKNCNKGIEFLDYTDGKTKTINTPGITIIHNDQDFADVCCVFYDLKDYIAFKNIEKSNIIKVPDYGAAMILSSVKQFPQVSVECDMYEKIFSYMPNNDTGRIITETLLARHDGKRLKDKSVLYKSYKNLYEYSKQLMI
jgi:hypothetical protein